MKWFLSKNEREYPHRWPALHESARLLLQQLIGSEGSIGFNWSFNFTNHKPTLHSKYICKYDYARAYFETWNSLKFGFGSYTIWNRNITSLMMISITSTKPASQCVSQVLHELLPHQVDAISLLDYNQATMSELQ